MDSASSTPGLLALDAVTHNKNRMETADLPDSCKKHSATALPGLSLSAFLQKSNEPRAPDDASPASDDPARDFERLVRHGYDRLPRPGGGCTLQRWQSLAQVAYHDLSLVKLFEGHTDALAIIHELDGPAPAPGSTWATWAAEAPHARVRMTRTAGAAVRLNGNKAWCSGARVVNHAVVSVWDENDQPALACIDLHQPGVVVATEGWEAVGMAATASTDVSFHHAVAVPLGRPGQYVTRPGFWQGGAGIAACWYGGALALADHVRQACAHRTDPFRLAHLGAIDVSLSQAAALLRETATWIDAFSAANAMAHALRARAGAEAAATTVLDHAGRALGATPFCRDRRFARMAADLPVFVRQSHAEQDLAALAQSMLDAGESTWAL